jgi:hypothetical protein
MTKIAFNLHEKTGDIRPSLAPVGRPADARSALIGGAVIALLVLVAGGLLFLLAR